MVEILTTGHRHNFDTAIAAVTTFPTNQPEFTGRLLCLRQSNGSRAILRGNGTFSVAEWEVLGVKPAHGTAPPTGAANYDGEERISVGPTFSGVTPGRAWWVAQGTDWRLIAQRAAQGDVVARGNITPDFVGQQYVQNSSLASISVPGSATFEATGLTTLDWRLLNQTPPVVTALPATGNFPGQLIEFSGAAGQRSTFRVANSLVLILTGSAPWIAANNPQGNRTPDFVGQFAWDSRAAGSGGEKLYFAKGLTNADWVLV